MTRRSESGATVERACRHLLLHLDDATKLRTNPLVAALFPNPGECTNIRVARQQALDTVRGIVAAAASDLLADGGNGPIALHTRRHHQILTRCDIHGESHKAVAADLGLSLRQFYRERRSVRTRVGSFVEKEVRRIQNRPAFVVDPFYVEFCRADMLFELGANVAAINLLEALRNSETESRKKLLAWITLLEIRAKCGDPIIAMSEWQGAVSESPSELRGWIDVALGTILWHMGNERESRRVDSQSRALLDGLASSVENINRDFALRQCLELIKRSGWTGSPAEVATLLEHTEKIFETVDQAGVTLQTTFLCELADSQIATCESPEIVEPLLAKIGELAYEHGLSASYAQFLLMLCIVEQLKGNLLDARRIVSDALRLLPTVATLELRRLATIRAADVEAELGQFKVAADIARSVRESVPDNSHLWLMASLVEAKSLTRLRNFEYTIPLLHSVYDATRSSALLMSVLAGGKAMHLLAENYAELGRSKEAGTCIEESIRILQGVGCPILLRRSFDAASRLGLPSRHWARP